MHSPVNVSIQGAEGYVGISTTTCDTACIEESVSNSYYFEFGEGKYLGVPLDGEEYTIELQGTSEGKFTLELREERGGVVSASKVFSNVPITPLTNGELKLTELGEVGILNLDTNGDSVPDTIVYEDGYKKPVSFELLINEIEKLDTKAKKQLLQTTYLAERFVHKGNDKIAKLMLNLIQKEIIFLSSKKHPKKLIVDKDDAQSILLIIQELQKTFL